MFVGSPTYANHPLPLVMDFLSRLPDIPGVLAAVFTTYGMVTSGVTLMEMAEALREKHLTVLGGIKVPAPHSMLWQDDNQPGKGRPDVEDKDRIRRFAQTVLEKAGTEAPAEVAPENFKYQRQDILDKAAVSGLHVLKPLLLPMTLDESACTECGVCIESCPTGNISLDPKPAFADKCILCFNCVRLCPEGAIVNNVLPMIGGEVLKRIDFYRETPEVKMFI